MELCNYPCPNKIFNEEAIVIFRNYLTDKNIRVY